MTTLWKNYVVLAVAFGAGVLAGREIPPEPSVPSETNIPVVSPSGIEVRIVGDEAEKWLWEVFPVVPDSR
jgi:hypothetical protein